MQRAIAIPRAHQHMRGALYQTVAFALQLEGAVDEKSPFKPAEVLQLHAERRPPADLGPPVESAPAGPNSHDTCAPREAPVPKQEAPAPASTSR